MNLLRLTGADKIDATCVYFSIYNSNPLCMLCLIRMHSRRQAQTKQVPPTGNVSFGLPNKKALHKLSSEWSYWYHKPLGQLNNQQVLVQVGVWKLSQGMQFHLKLNLKSVHNVGLKYWLESIRHLFNIV